MIYKKRYIFGRNLFLKYYFHDSIGHFCSTYVSNISFPVGKKETEQKKKPNELNEQLN